MQTYLTNIKPGIEHGNSQWFKNETKYIFVPLLVSMQYLRPFTIPGPIGK